MIPAGKRLRVTDRQGRQGPTQKRTKSQSKQECLHTFSCQMQVTGRMEHRRQSCGDHPYSHVCPEAALPGRPGVALSRHTGNCAPRHSRPEEDREEPSTCVTGGRSKQVSGGANRKCPPRCQAAGQSLLKAFKMVGFGERNLF